MTYVKPFSEISHDNNIVGGKASNLAELCYLGVNVPLGFVVTTDAYTDFLRKYNLEERIQERLRKLDETDANQIKSTAAYLRSLHRKPVPRTISEPILELYDEIGDGFAAIRSSATAEDLSSASFAGQYESFLSVSRKNLVNSVRKCWESLYTDRSLQYRLNHKIRNSSMAVVVQKMIDSVKSGVMFTNDPGLGGMLIDVVEGLGETYVSGRTGPSASYFIRKEYISSVGLMEPDESPGDFFFFVQTRSWNKQDFMLTRNKSGKIVKRAMPMDRRIGLENEQIKTLARFGGLIENHYQRPMDIEFATDESGKVYILQARPITAKV